MGGDDLKLERIEESMILSSKLFLQSFIRSNISVQPVEEMLNEATLKKDFLDEIFRFAYQLMFIQLGEEQGVFPSKTCSGEVRKAYSESLSLTNIGGGSNDSEHFFIERVRAIINGLSEGSNEFGLEPLHSKLFSPDATPLLNQLQISNEDFFSGYSEILISKLFLEKIPTDEKAAMLGTIFQSLLNFQNFEFNTDDSSVAIIHASGSNRKSTGSFYTPHDLVEHLVEDTLRPLIRRIYIQAENKFPSEDSSKQRDEFIASEILDLNICEPSCGSGHFLFGTLDYLSTELASLGIHSDSDKKQFYWQVITNCLYGIDIFADVLEICKFVLWLKGKESAPDDSEFTFQHIRLKHGNSLLSQFSFSSGMVSDQANKLRENRTANTTLRKENRHYKDSILKPISVTKKAIAREQDPEQAVGIMAFSKSNKDPEV